MLWMKHLQKQHAMMMSVQKKTIVNTKYFVISKILHTFDALFERLAFVL